MQTNTALSAVLEKAAPIKLVLTDCDGVLTDAGVYYSAHGEEMKRFSMRDGMGVERLRIIAGVEVGIVTGENSPIVAARAAKLQITQLHLGVKDKHQLFLTILEQQGLQPAEVAFIGDDMNDEAVLRLAGLSACPADALAPIKSLADYCCQQSGGHGAFRELAELILFAKGLTTFEPAGIFNTHLIAQLEPVTP